MRAAERPVEHLETFAGILQADSFAGYNRLYAATRLPGPVTEVPCFSHARRKFFELVDIAAGNGRKNAPLAMEAVKRIDLLFDIERGMNGETAARRHAVRQELSTPLVAELETWMRTERARLSRHTPVANAWTTCSDGGRLAGEPAPAATDRWGFEGLAPGRRARCPACWAR